MHPDADIYPRLIRLAAGCRKASDFSRILEELAKYAEADGCTVWEIFHAGTNDRKYFKLAEHFPVDDPAKQHPWYFLREGCLTGDAIRTNETRVVADIDSRIGQGELPFGHLLKDRGIKSFCSVPLPGGFGKMREAAVNFYWKKQRSFESDQERNELERIEKAARTIPDLNHGVLNKMGFELLQTVEKKLNEGGAVLQNVLAAVTEQFNAVESAIYLEDRANAPGEYELKAYFWPWDFPKKERYLAGEAGITAWAMDKDKPVRFVDLGQFEAETRTRGYDGMIWTTRAELLESAEQQYGKALPPLGFVCTPVRDGKRVVGAIRCCMTKNAPHLFDESHIAILGLVADQIGHWWGNQVALFEEKADKERFKKLVEGIASMHQDAALRLSKDPSNMKPLWEKSLSLIANIAPWQDALSIRALDQKKEELYYVATHGKAWEEGGAKQAQTRLERRYPLSGPYPGSKAVRECFVLVEPDAGKPGKFGSELFPAATRVIHAPIRFGKKPIGVVDVRGFGPKPIPANLGLMCELIGLQLGLYHKLGEQIQVQKSQENKLAKQYDEQNQIYEDFLHQLRNPLLKASMLAQRAADPKTRDGVDLRQLRYFVRHVLQFSESLNHFTALSKGEQLQTRPEVLTYDYVVSALKEMAADEALIVPEDRGLTFEVDEASFEPFRRKTVFAAKDLLEHCLFNLLDNAVKYSFSNTEITLRGRVQESEKNLMISVINRGHRIESTTRKRLVERGYRGDRALLTTAGGRGIGLWIVSQFMTAMNGALVIVPTDSRGLNEFQLVFRCR